MKGWRTIVACVIASCAIAACSGSDGSGRVDGSVPSDTLPSTGCGMASTYPSGQTSADELVHDGQTRTFRVRVPPSYDGHTAVPLVLMFHGGGGSGRQFEERSSRMNPVADREGFIVVYPDGTGALRTWNGGGCCGAAVANNVDDVGFVAALLDHLEGALCIDRRRVHASGMSNGGILTHRLACELPERFASVAPVASAEMSPTCTPAVPIALMHIHGTQDGNVPPSGGVGCGPSQVSFPPLAETMERRRILNGCAPTTTTVLVEGDGTCVAYDGCEADVVLCRIEGGGHNWPGGDPPADIVDCPADGGQSTTFVASEIIWDFFAAHPRPVP